MVTLKIRIANLVYNISRAIVYMVLFSLASVLIIARIKPAGFSKMSTNVDKSITDSHIHLARDLEKLIIGVSLEEVIFRILPFTLFISLIFLFKIESKYKRYFFWIIGIIASIGFGYAHGNYLNVFIQGASGLVLWWLLMVLIGSFRGINSYLAISFSFFLVIFTHFTFDFILIYNSKLLLIPIFLNFFLSNYKEKWKGIS